MQDDLFSTTSRYCIYICIHMYMYIRSTYAQRRPQRDHVTITATPTCGIHPASNKTPFQNDGYRLDSHTCVGDYENCQACANSVYQAFPLRAEGLGTRLGDVATLDSHVRLNLGTKFKVQNACTQLASHAWSCRCCL